MASDLHPHVGCYRWKALHGNWWGHRYGFDRWGHYPSHQVWFLTSLVQCSSHSLSQRFATHWSRCTSSSNTVWKEAPRRNARTLILNLSVNVSQSALYRLAFFQWAKPFATAARDWAVFAAKRGLQLAQYRAEKDPTTPVNAPAAASVSAPAAKVRFKLKTILSLLVNTWIDWRESTRVSPLRLDVWSKRLIWSNSYLLLCFQARLRASKPLVVSNEDD